MNTHNTVALVWLCMSVSVAGGDAQESVNLDVIGAMASVDKVYSQSLTLVGKETTGSYVLRPADPGGVFEWRLTRRGDDIALHRKLIEPRPLVFLPKGYSTQVHHDEEGNLLTSVLMDEKFRVTASDRCHIVRYDICTVSPGGVVLKREPQDRIDYYSVDDHEADLPLYRIMWSAGRGLSSHLEQVLESKVNSEGSLELKVSGFMAPPTRGVWDIVVNPSRSYLVTKANFTREGRTTPTISIVNHHSTATGACEVASGASCALNVGFSLESTSQCEACDFTVDEQLLDLCERAKKGPFPPYSLGLDKRLEEIEVIDLTPPPTFQASLVDQRFFRPLPLLVLHLMIGALWYIFYRRRTRDRELAMEVKRS